jgi:hypothetical protein
LGGYRGGSPRVSRLGRVNTPRKKSFARFKRQTPAPGDCLRTPAARRCCDTPEDPAPDCPIALVYAPQGDPNIPTSIFALIRRVSAPSEALIRPKYTDFTKPKPKLRTRDASVEACFLTPLLGIWVGDAGPGVRRTAAVR